MEPCAAGQRQEADPSTTKAKVRIPDWSETSSQCLCQRMIPSEQVRFRCSGWGGNIWLEHTFARVYLRTYQCAKALRTVRCARFSPVPLPFTSLVSPSPSAGHPPRLSPRCSAWSPMSATGRRPVRETTPPPLCPTSSRLPRDPLAAHVPVGSAAVRSPSRRRRCRSSRSRRRWGKKIISAASRAGEEGGDMPASRKRRARRRWLWAKVGRYIHKRSGAQEQKRRTLTMTLFCLSSTCPASRLLLSNGKAPLYFAGGAGGRRWRRRGERSAGGRRRQRRGGGGRRLGQW